MQSEVNGSSPHYLRSSKYPTARRRRGFTGEFADGSYQCDDECANDSIQRSQQCLAVPANFQKRLENDGEVSRRSKRKFSDTNGDESEPFSASRLASCQKLPAHKCFSCRTSIPKRPRLFMSSLQVTDVSRILQDDGNCSGMNTAHNTNQSSFPQRTARQEQVACQVLDPIVQPLQDETAHTGRDDPTQEHMSSDACGNHECPFESRNSSAVSLFPTGSEAAAKRPTKNRTTARVMLNFKSRVDPVVLSKTGAETFVSSNASDLEESEAPSSQFGVESVFPEYGSGPSVFQFPYKKRPHNFSSFLAVAAPRCFDQPLSIEYPHPGYFMDLTDRNELPCFKPLYYLQQLLTSQQVEHITALNPGTE